MPVTKEQLENRKEFPDNFLKLGVFLHLTEEQHSRLCAGLKRSGMDHRWFVYTENDVSFFHRTWTGACIYKIPLTQMDNGWVIQDVFVNTIDLKTVKDPEFEKNSFIELLYYFFEDKL